MAASEYTFITYSLRTMGRLAELPLYGVSYGDKLNRAETMTGKVALNDANVRSIDIVSATERGRTGIYIDRAGVPVWDGILWDRTYDSQSTELTLNCSSTWSYWSHRRNAITATFTGADQWSIFWTMMANNMFGGAAGTINVVLQTIGTTGRLRDRTYWQYERRQMNELIEDLAAVQDGFDFGFELAYVAGTIQRTLTLYYPRRGRAQAVSGHVLEYGPNTRGNVIKYSWPDLGSAEANQVYNFGAGTGVDMLVASRVRGDRLTAGWPILEEVISNKSTTQLSTLISQAQAEVDAKADIQATPKVTILADVDPAFGAWQLGDDVRLRISDYRFPQNTDGTPGLDTWRRITGYKVDVPDDGSAETVDLSLALAQ